MKNKLINTMKDEKGTASILTVVMAAAIITVTSSFIVASSENLNSSLNIVEKNVYYYELDTMGENYIADVDSKLSLAEEEAINYILNRDFEKYAHKDMPVELQNKIREMVGDTNHLNFTLNEVMNIVYLYYSDLGLNELKEKYESSIVSSLKTEEEVQAIIGEVFFTPVDRLDIHLNISLNVNKLDYFFEINEDIIMAEKLSKDRFSIISWVQW